MAWASRNIQRWHALDNFLQMRRRYHRQPGIPAADKSDALGHDPLAHSSRSCGRRICRVGIVEMAREVGTG